MKKTDRVEVLSIQEKGTIINIRNDSDGQAIFTVKMDQPTEVFDGIMVARSFELKKL